MPVSFHYVHPDSFPFLPLDVVKYFEKASLRSQSLLTPHILIARARNGLGEVFIIEKDGAIMGAVYMVIQQTDMGKILNIPLLGGRRLVEWKDELRTFVRQIMMQHVIDQLVVISGRAWWRFFPELKEDSVIFTARVMH